MACTAATTSSFEEDNMRSIGDFSIDLGLGTSPRKPSSGSISSISFGASYASMFGASCASLCQSRWDNPAIDIRTPAAAAAAQRTAALRIPPFRVSNSTVNKNESSLNSLFGESFSTLEGGNNNDATAAQYQQDCRGLIPIQQHGPPRTRYIKKNNSMTRNRNRMLPLRTKSGDSFGRSGSGGASLWASANTFGASFATLGEASHGTILSTWESVGEESNVSGDNNDDDDDDDDDDLLSEDTLSSDDNNDGTVVTNYSSRSKKSSKSRSKTNNSRLVKRRHSIGDTSSIISRQSDMLKMTATQLHAPPLSLTRTQEHFEKKPENEYHSRSNGNIANTTSANIDKDDVGPPLLPPSVIHNSLLAPRLPPRLPSCECVM